MSNESPDNDDTATSKTVPPTANSGAIATMGLELQKGRIIPRKQIFSRALWARQISRSTQSPSPSQRFT